ncbi:hypothetical protein [Paracraurococcus ruber]|uniref:Uncharacterized protein n=1 Tax=Paracraurococcus ruber TaxID=77675 RepID=A0ABS1D3Y6_9PROT|nr:hypothetical protein [Paracraurococcus ruber]MBK1661203.1 hypothetical protein [Paracraurococcus ruber]TDG28120.1 hypothetical protein E2C05_21305 [Paracraurococcus ruber]
MSELTFVLAGQNTATAADQLTMVLTDGERVRVHRTEAAALPEAERKAVDPISLAALLVSLPSAVLTVMDITDRIRKHRKAQAVIEAAQKLKAEKQIEVYLLTASEAPNQHTVASLDADRLLDLIAAIDSSPAKPR